jgi:hypothetical protein
MHTRGGSSLSPVIVSVLLVGIMSLGLTGTAAAVLSNLKLSGSLIANGDVLSFKISPDERYAVFLADARANAVDELFSVPAKGGTRTRISRNLLSGEVVQGFIITPDSQSVVYWTSTAEGVCTGVYAVPIAGGSQVDLLGYIPSNKKMGDIAVSGDSQYVVYILKHSDDPFRNVLWAAPMDGSGPTALTDQACEACFINFRVTPAGAEVVYTLESIGPIKLYRANMRGVRQELDSGSIFYFSVSPDGDWVVYQKWVSEISLYSIPIEGGSPILLSNEGEGSGVVGFQIAPNSQQVVYRADPFVARQFWLFSVPIDGSAERVSLLSSMTPEGDVVEFQITPNSQGVVYLADQLVDERFDLGAVGINGGPVYWLNKEMVPEGDVTDFAITPNSLGVAFIADKFADERFELFTVSIFGTQLSRVSADLPAGGVVLDFKIAPNSQGVVYRADQYANDVIALYAVPIVGGAEPARVNAPLVPGGDVQAYALTSDSKGVLYIADQETDGLDELFAMIDRLVLYLPLVVK